MIAIGSESAGQRRAPKVTRGPRPRKVFGRREAEIDGKAWRFELRADGLHVRRKRARKERVLTFKDALQAAQGQLLMKL